MSGLSQAEALVDAGRGEQALDLLSRVDGGADPAVHGLRCRALISLQRWDEALTAAEEAAALAPYNAHPQVLQSLALRRLGRKQQSRDAAAEAVRLAPHWPGAWAALVDAQLLVDAREARQSLARLLELAPDSAYAHELAGEVAQARLDLPTAEAAYRHALTLDPDNGRLLARLSAVVERQGRYRESGGLLGDALAIEPQLAPVDGAMRLEWKIHLAVGTGAAQVLGFLLTRVDNGDYTEGTRAILLLLGLVLGPFLLLVRVNRQRFSQDRATRARLAPLQPPVRMVLATCLAGMTLGLVPWVLGGLLGPGQWDWFGWLLGVGLALGLLGRSSWFVRRRRRPRAPAPPPPEVQPARAQVAVGAHLRLAGEPVLLLRAKRLAGRVLLGAPVVGTWALIGPPARAVAIGLAWCVADAVLCDRLWPPQITSSRVAHVTADGRLAGVGRTVLHGLARLAVAPWLLLQVAHRPYGTAALPHDRLVGVRAVVVRRRTAYDDLAAQPAT